MPDPAERDLIQETAGFVQVLHPDVPQRFDAQHFGPELARGAARRVAAVGVGVGNLCVDHQQHQACRLRLERHQAGTLVPAVQKDGMAPRPAQRGGLVHDARGRSDKVILGALGGQDHFLGCEPCAGQLVEGGDDGALNGVGRGESGAEGNVGVQQ
ncbi:hypothetical protein D9M72_407370 [compost metagenome]